MFGDNSSTSFSNRRKNNKSILKFKAIVDSKTVNYAEKIADWKNIKGNIKKVSSIGVFIDVPKHKLELYISKKELKKELEDFKLLLNNNMEVTIQLLDDKNAIVMIVL